MHRIGIITTFGVTAFVTGLASTVYALPNTQSQTDAGVTLSGESLRGVENRNADKDFSSFFTGSSPILQSGNNDVLNSPDRERSPLGNLEFRGGSLDRGNNNDPLRSTNGDSDQQFGVRYRVDDR